MIIITNNYEDFLTITGTNNIVLYANDSGHGGFSAYFIKSFPSDMIIYGDPNTGDGLGAQPTSFSTNFPNAIMLDELLSISDGRNVIVTTHTYNDFLLLESTFGRKGQTLYQINSTANTSSLYCFLSADKSITYASVPAISSNTITTSFSSAIELNMTLDLGPNTFLDFTNYSDFLEIISLLGNKWNNNIFYDSVGSGNFNIWYLFGENNLFTYFGPTTTLNTDLPSAILLSGPLNNISFDGVLGG
jgi:hypothetical protein